MATLIEQLETLRLISPPPFLSANTVLLCVVRQAIEDSGGKGGKRCDIDIAGVCVPPRERVFPHLSGSIPGFGAPPELFRRWDARHAKRTDGVQTNYDFAVHGIVRFVELCRRGDPHMIGTLFVPDRLVLHQTPAGAHLRARRSLFLHGGALPGFRDHAQGKLDRARQALRAAQRAETPETDAGEGENVDAPGIGKQAGAPADEGEVAETCAPSSESLRRHATVLGEAALRLVASAEQIVTEGHLDTERHARAAADRTPEDLAREAEARLAGLDGLLAASVLPDGPDEAAMRRLLHECLDLHYGPSAAQPIPSALIRDLRALLDRHAAP